MARRTMWAAQYKTAPGGTLENWIYLAACTVICRQGEEQLHEKRCREIAQSAFDEKTCIIHAAWKTAGSHGHCYCTPCANSRKENYVLSRDA